MIEPVFLDYAHDWTVATPFFRQFSLIGKPSAALDIPSFASDMGTVGGNGSGVDGEFDATQATDLANTALDTNKVTLTAAEYGVLRTVTDNVSEDSISVGDFFGMVVADAARILMTALEYDALNLLPSLSNVIGTSGSDLTVAQMINAADDIRARGFRAPDGLVYVVDDEQYLNLRTALIATSTSLLSYGIDGSSLLDIQKDPMSGMADGRTMVFRGWPVYVTGLGPTANSGADVTGACFTKTGPQNDPMATFGIAWKRMFRAETQRDVSLRADEVAFTMRCAVGEINDGSGSAIVTDAP